MTDERTDGFDGFLRENYPLFAVMGVFGAVAIYLTRLPGGTGADRQPAIQLGVLSSLLLFVLTGLYVDRRVVDEFESGLALLTALVARRGLGYSLFLVPFNVLVLAVVLTALDFPRVLPVVGGFMAFVVGFVLFNEVASALVGLVYDGAARREKTGRFALATVVLSGATAGGAALALRRVPMVAVGAWFPPTDAGSVSASAFAGPFLAGVALDAGVMTVASLALAGYVLAARLGR